MRLEHLRQNFAKMAFAEQLSFMEAYRKKREVDLNTVVPLPARQAKKKLSTTAATETKPRTKKKEKMIPVTPEALQMLRSLGLIQ